MNSLTMDPPVNVELMTVLLDTVTPFRVVFPRTDPFSTVLLMMVPFSTRRRSTRLFIMTLSAAMPVV